MTTTKSGGPVATLNTKIPYSLKKRLETFASETNQPQVQVIIAALEEHLEKHSVTSITGAGLTGTPSPQTQKEESEMKKIKSSKGPVDVITKSSGVCTISPPGELLYPDAEPGDPGYGVKSKSWALLPEGSDAWEKQYPSLEQLLQAEKEDIIGLAD